MSAGTGVTHSEMNEGDEEVHLIQTWIIPQEKGLAPQYGSKVFTFSDRHNKWLHLVGPEQSDAAITIYQDANMFASELDARKVLRFELQSDRQVYVKVMEGEGLLNGTALSAGDAAEVTDENLDFVAISDLHLLLVEMAKS